ncbi:MAG: hypothetical protein ACR2OM_02295 [Aestuariivirgaceae bacterium]
MRTVPAVLRLTDFSAQAGAISEDHLPPVLPMLEAAEFDDTDGAPLQAAIEQARCEASAQAEAMHAQQLAEANEAFEERLADARAKWVEEQAAVLADQLPQQFEAAGNELAERLFAHCRPVLGTIARDRAVAELEDILQQVIEANCQIDVSGPADLIEALRNKLADSPLRVNWHEGAGADLSIKAGETLIETRLADWLADTSETGDG